MAFERYLKLRGQVANPAAALWRTGQIGLNRAAIHEFGLAKMTHVVLFFDRERKKIGLRFTASAKEEGALRLNTRGGGTAVFAKGFLKLYGVDFSKPRRFKLVRDEKHDLLVLEAE